MSVVTLLDVNVLLALFAARHIHHELAHDWFEEQRPHGWATCPLTENSFIRLMSQPTRGSAPYRPVEVAETLRTFCLSSGHQFWPASLSIRDEGVFNPSLVRGHQQVTDTYLLALAKLNGGSLATFDRGVQLGSVKGATKANLQVISADPAESTSEDR